MNTLTRTDRAENALYFAEVWARWLNHEQIGTEHVLYGIIKDGDNDAVTILRNLRVKPVDVQNLLENIIKPTAPKILKGNLAHTPRAQSASNRAHQEAVDMECNFIGTEHMLLGLLLEEGSVASDLLLHFGLTVESAREEAKKIHDAHLTQIDIPTFVDEIPVTVIVPIPAAKETAVIVPLAKETKPKAKTKVPAETKPVKKTKSTPAVGSVTKPKAKSKAKTIPVDDAISVTKPKPVSKTAEKKPAEKKPRQKKADKNESKEQKG